MIFFVETLKHNVTSHHAHLMKGIPLQIHLTDGNDKTGFEGFMLNTEMLSNLISIWSEYMSKDRKERTKAVPTFPSIFKNFIF
jgi:hypothetical protein